MHLKSIDNYIIQNNNMMQYMVHYFSEFNKKEKEKKYINLWQYGYTSHLFTSSHCKAPKTTSTHSLQNLWWVHKFFTYIFFSVIRPLQKKQKKTTVFFLNDFSEHSTWQNNELKTRNKFQNF